jgi:RNA polymerase sigma-70 factor (ECF subfamily)
MEEPMSTPVSIDSRFVAQHEDFLRRLARGLVGLDSAAIDDAVQDVWVRALAAPPRESPRAYLAATLRNGVARVRSRERARGAVERSAARGERIGGDPRASSAGLLDGDIDRRLALHEELARALRGLPDEQRRALFLRYSEDLTPAEIAARTDEPLGTVKTRLARGLAALRADLDARYGGERASWAMALPLGEPLVGPLEWAKSGGVSAMHSFRALALLGAAAVTLVAAGLYSAWPALPRATELAMTPPSNAAAAPAAVPSGTPAAPGVPPRSAALHAAVESGTSTQDPPLVAGDASVRIALVDEGGAPIVGAAVRATAREHSSQLLADWGALPESLERVATSSAQGEATLELPAHPALLWDLDVVAEGYGGLALSIRTLVPRLPFDLGELRLAPEAVLEIEVRGPSGELCDDPGELTIRVDNDAGDRSARLWHRRITPHGGRVIARGIPAGRVLVRLNAESSTELTLGAGETRAVTLTLDRAPDPERVGLGLSKVFGLAPSPTEVSLVLADGSVRAPEAQPASAPSAGAEYVWRQVPEGEHTLRVVAPGHEPTTTPATRGSSHWLRLEPSSGVRLAFVDGAGVPLESRALVEREQSSSWSSVTRPASVAPAVALPAGEHRLRISGERFARVEVTIEALALDEWRDVTVTVAPLDIVTGTVVDAVGQIVPGTLVQVLAPAEVGDGLHSPVLFSQPGPGSAPQPAARQELGHTYSDAAGRFRMYVARTGPLVVRAQRLPAATDALELELGLIARRQMSSSTAIATERALGLAEECRDVELTLSTGAMVAGRLVGSGIAPFDDLAVVMVRESLVAPGSLEMATAMQNHMVEAAETGEFELGPVAPDRYVLFAFPSVQMSGSSFQLAWHSLLELARFEVPASGLGGLEIPLDGLVPPLVEVRVRTSLPRGHGLAGDPYATLLLSSRVLETMGRNGPLAHLTAPAPHGWGANEASATTAVGRLRLGPEPRWRLWVNDRSRGWTVHRDVDLTTLSGPIELDVELIDAALTLVTASGPPLAGQEVWIAQPSDYARSAPATHGATGDSTDLNGRIELRLPPGDVELTLPRPGGQVRVGPVLWPPPAGTVLVVPD